MLSARSTSATIIGSAETEREFGERLKKKEDNLAAVLDNLINTQQAVPGRQNHDASGEALYNSRTLEDVAQL